MISVPGERQTIDVNADVGEVLDHDGIAGERALLSLVSSAHIACGGHAGDERTMRATVKAALANGVRVGAHPSYPDRSGFGRRPMEIGRDELSSALTGQLRTLVEVAGSLGTEVRSVKPHGALYAEVARGTDICAVLLDVMHGLCGPQTTLVLPSGARAVEVVQESGFMVQQEGFADRAYRSDGGLVAREESGSVYSDPALAAAQALRLAVHGTVVAVDGGELSLPVDTICLHGDSPNVVAMARAVREALSRVRIAVAVSPADID